MTTGDVVTIIVIVAMVGSILITIKDSFKKWFWTRLKPNKCPKCKARKILKIEYGHPGPELDEKDDIYWGGCCIFGHDPKWHCASCHWQWGNGSKGAYCEDDIDEKECIEPGLLMETAKEQFKLNISSPHGINHWERVKIIGEYLLEDTDADWEVICCFAYFHDVKRETEGDDLGHGFMAGKFVNEFFYPESGDLSKKQIEQLKYACDFHCQLGAKSDDITVQTCWDADRLDLWRVGTIPDPQFLNTEKAKQKETIEWSKKLYENWGG